MSPSQIAMDLGITPTRAGTWVLVISVTLMLYNAWRLFLNLWWKPLGAKRFLEAQGLKGMPFRVFVGNVAEFRELCKKACSSPMPEISHDIAPRILPYCFVWRRELGNNFFFWFDSQPRICISEPELAREMLSNKSGHYPKIQGRPDTRDLVGMGLITLEGEKWAQHRRIISPAFFMDKLKGMNSTMAACILSMLNNWTTQIEMEASGRKEIDVLVDFRNLTADIIAHTAFGSSYAEGKQVFHIQHEQQALASTLIRTVYIPGSRFIPTKTNRHRWKMDAQVQQILRQLIQSRMDAIESGREGSYGDDLLGLMMAANRKELKGNQKNLSMEIGEMVDECKTFFFAGHETTSTLLTWTMLVLGTSIEWQDRAREEVLSVCGKESPTTEALNSLKTVGMVLYEVLRLYPPGCALAREVGKDMRVGKHLILPQGATILVPLLAFHHDPQYWGPNAHLFNPERFADGIAKASTDPAAFMPFSMGPRNCVGQNFALLEAKIALAMILQRFTFHISPTYTHAPLTLLSLQPQFGMQIMFEKLSPM